MSLRNICRREVVCVNVGTSVKKAAQLMEEKNIGSLIIVEKESVKPIGLVTDRDILLRAVNKGLNPENVPVEEVMTKNIVTLDERIGLFEALEQTKESGMRRFPVVDINGHLQGIITLDDIIYLLGKEMGDVASIIEKEGPRL